MTKHTPGPWATEGAGIKSCMVSATLKSGRRVRASIAVCKDNGGDFDTDMVSANARLIAAAPDLLSALRMVAYNEKAPGDIDWDAVNAAIAKAEGR